MPAPLDLIVANLPYVPEAAAADHPDLWIEPADAVFTAGDGLGLYRRLIDDAADWLAADGALLLQLDRRILVAERSELAALRAAIDDVPPAGPEMTSAADVSAQVALRVNESHAARRWRSDLIGPACPKRQPESKPRQEAIVPHPLEVAPTPAENVTILIADDESSFRSFLALKLRDSVVDVDVLEAIDGAEAVQLGLQQHPPIALLDVSMPRLGGLEAALTLRSLRPTMEIALQSGDAEEYRVRAADLGLPLFDKRDLEQPLAWVKARARELITRENRSPPTEKRLAFDQPA